MRGFCSKFSVRLACGRIRHHRWSGKSYWVLPSPAIKYSLKVQMTRYAEFLWWMCGGTNWNILLTYLMKVLITLVHSLSRMCRLGFKPLLVNMLWSFWSAVFKSSPDIVFIGYAWMVLESCVMIPVYNCCPCWMELGTFLFSLCKIFLSNPLSWGKQDWCLLTAWIGGIGLVLDLVPTGLPFPVLI